MKYAVVSLQGKQYRVEEGQTLLVDRVTAEVGKKMDLSEILLAVDDNMVMIGSPFLEKTKVKATVVSHEKGDKIRVATYKAKSRYRKVRGHRQPQSLLKIEAITLK